MSGLDRHGELLLVAMLRLVEEGRSMRVQPLAWHIRHGEHRVEWDLRGVHPLSSNKCLLQTKELSSHQLQQRRLELEPMQEPTHLCNPPVENMLCR